MKPLRRPPVFGLTRTTTVPGPVPEAPLTMLIQASLTVAVQLHALAVLTATVTVPPAAGSVTLLLGEIEYEQLRAPSLIEKL